MSERHLFLKGNSGVGKTTLLLSFLQPYWQETGGFLSQRLFDENGETKGFCLVPVGGCGRTEEDESARRTTESESEEDSWFLQPAALYRAGGPNIFIEKTEAGWQKRPEVFESAGVKILEHILAEKEHLKFCYLDEIGGVELKSERFMELFYRVLECGVPCIGVLKNSGNFRSMTNRVPVASDFLTERDRLEERLSRRYGCRIYPYTGEKEEMEEIGRFVKERYREQGQQERG